MGTLVPSSEVRNSQKLPGGFVKNYQVGLSPKDGTKKHHQENVQVETEVGGREYEDVPVEDIEEGRHDILSWECQPGDVVVFHGLTLHGAK